MFSPSYQLSLFSSQASWESGLPPSNRLLLPWSQASTPTTAETALGSPSTCCCQIWWTPLDFHVTWPFSNVSSVRHFPWLVSKTPESFDFLLVLKPSILKFLPDASLPSPLYMLNVRAFVSAGFSSHSIVIHGHGSKTSTCQWCLNVYF